MSIIVIESPNKVKKVAEYSGFKTFATAGHFKDLPSNSLGVDEKFVPKFAYDDKKRPNIKKLIESCKDQEVFIASDPDREGYAIGMMVYQEIKKVAKKIMRAEFSEITQKGIKQGLSNAVEFEKTNFKNYDSFLGRRIGDRLVGYLISPHAAKALNIKDISSGRVQSPGVRLIVEREREINKFNALPREEKIVVELAILCKKDNTNFVAKYQLDGKPKTFTFAEKEDAQSILSQLLQTATVDSVKTAPTKSDPGAPFTTVSLQASANSRLSFGTDHTMNIAQKLFEEGLITYHRTDSTRLSDEFIDECRIKLGENFEQRAYKSQNSQADAHEAIRPTHLDNDVSNLAAEEKLLYDLIYKQSLACQAKPAIYDKTDVILNNNGHLFKASGKVLIEKGYLEILMDDEEDTKAKKEKEDNQSLPKMTESEVINCEPNLKEREKTAPARYTEATLVRELEKKGIGRPSTYASIISTIKRRKYIEFQKKYILPTLTGDALIGFLETHPTFQHVIDYAFTADLETQLDDVVNGKISYQQVLTNLCTKLNISASEPTPHFQASTKETNLACPKCQQPIVETDKVFKCQQNLFVNGKQSGCPFSIFKDSKPLGAILTEEDVSRLLSGEVLSSPSGGTLELDLESQYFTKGKFGNSGGDKPNYASKSLGACKCGGDITESPKAFNCKKCGAIIWKTFKGQDVSAKNAVSLLAGNSVKLAGLDSKCTYDFSDNKLKN